MPIDWTTFGVDLHLDLGAGGAAAGRRAALERALRDAVRTGRLAPHTRLPSTRALATELAMARGTVAAAYDQLVAEGYLGARTGSGTFVAALPGPPSSAKRPAPDERPPRYDLRPGSPDLSTFPTAAWLRATRRALAAAPDSAYDYGDPQGRIELRTALAGYLSRARGVLATPEQIVITSGYVQALGLLTDVLGTEAPACVAMEDPSLGFHREVLRRRGATVVALPVDDLGARTDLLATPAFAAVRAAVLTPAHQYPTGVTLRPHRRHVATEWARARGGLLIEDDYDGEFRYDRQPVGAVQGTAPDHVAYVGTASKTLGPGLRLAWLVLPQRLVEPVAEAKRYADLHTGGIAQLTLAEMINSHAYDRHVRACRLHYRRRRDLLIDRLEATSAPIAVHGVAAGLHAMISLPAVGPDEDELISRAAAYDLALVGLREHWHTIGDHPQALIVGYATPRRSAFPAALDTLVRVLRTTTHG